MSKLLYICEWILIKNHRLSGFWAAPAQAKAHNAKLSLMGSLDISITSPLAAFWERPPRSQVRNMLKLLNAWNKEKWFPANLSFNWSRIKCKRSETRWHTFWMVNLLWLRIPSKQLESRGLEGSDEERCWCQVLTLFRMHIGWNEKSTPGPS